MVVRLNDDGVKINKCDGRLWDNYLIRCNYCGSVMYHIEVADVTASVMTLAAMIIHSHLEYEL